MERPPSYPAKIYERRAKQLVQGDICSGFFHQLRKGGGEPVGPRDPGDQSPQLPYIGPWQDRQVELDLPDGRKTKLTVRFWLGTYVVLHQNCEIAWADANDSRVMVAPIAFEAQWTQGPWDLIRRGELPGYLYLPGMSTEEAEEVGAPTDLSWGNAAVVFSSITLLSRGLATQREKMFRLTPEMIPLLQESLVTATTVRGWAAARDLDNWLEKRVIDVQVTSETVAGPSKLAKIFLVGNDGEVEEATVSWGLRPSS